MNLLCAEFSPLRTFSFGACSIKRRQVIHIVTLCLVIVTLLSAVSSAATINYGNFNVASAGVMFLQVRESSATDAVPLYGPPDPFLVGLDFDPMSFGSFASGGAADVTDGQLNFTVMGLVNAGGHVGIDQLSLFEAGDYSLAGLGGPSTAVFAGAIIRAAVTQINGVNVAPIDLLPVNASFGDALPPTVIVNPWSLGTTLSIGAQLAGLGYPADAQATKVEVAINNQILSTSEPGTVAVIAKKEFRINIRPEITGDPFGIPEPATLSLLATVVCLMAWRRFPSRTALAG
jgi:hypothetical protein